MKSITVVGSGIVGLTSAISLQEAGFHVRLVAKELYDKTLSSKVGAIWFPFEIQPKEKTNHWATLAYERYESEIKEGNGVSFIPFITAYTPESNIDWTKQLPEGKVRKAKPEELPKGMQMAFISEVPLAEPQLYLPHLFERFIDNGGSFEKWEITSLEEMAGLDALVINCTGLGAKALCNDDDLHPMRGQILRCEKMDIPSFADPTKRGALSYVINRSEDSVIGGTDYENDWNETEDPADTTLILERLKEASNAESPQLLEVMVGLRPRRSAVRFEFDGVFSTVFHNYGHGGAGFTVAWGCALELADLLVKRQKH
ncbi:FAD-dependent oxidoreductase [Algoriphagus yeomjeoni]|uniref:D-amino-acid oxidase n=1 Tax=Algoriphagus yeomjeoni TaxID=291403 RepID=A0A327P1Q8_9BACT|nr:FAD-dependent oxidoreductase [Algoriphagus yeomjeoni]RAI85633.1 D-amino-acid:oxygen oxidoreductase (deaminating) [Algoriphagus yeomjeoni]